jgi:hypothetical protein
MITKFCCCAKPVVDSGHLPIASIRKQGIQCTSDHGTYCGSRVGLLARAVLSVYVYCCRYDPLDVSFCYLIIFFWNSLDLKMSA